MEKQTENTLIDMGRREEREERMRCTDRVTWKLNM